MTPTGAPWLAVVLGAAAAAAADGARCPRNRLPRTAADSSVARVAAAVPHAEGLGSRSAAAPRRSAQLMAARTAAAVAGLGAALLAGLPWAPAAGLVVGWSAWRALRRLPVDDPRSAAQLLADLPGTAELLAAAIEAGADLRTALAAVAECGGPAAARLGAAARLLHLGAPAERAWTALTEEGGSALAPLATALTLSADTGAALAERLLQLAADARAKVALASGERARRAGVRAVAPLGLCFLPAFVLVGVVPIVAAGLQHLPS